MIVFRVAAQCLKNVKLKLGCYRLQSKCKLKKKPYFHRGVYHFSWYSWTMPNFGCDSMLLRQIMFFFSCSGFLFL